MKIFLSSTYIDLVEHRNKVVEAVERLGDQAVRMEVFGARPKEPTLACLEDIRNCDRFVGIYAHRYGFMPEGSNVSITEQEFDEAIRCSKPVFCFVVHEDHAWVPKFIEGDPGAAALRSFKEKIQDSLVRDFFTTPDDLAIKVATALGRFDREASPSDSERKSNPFHERFQEAGDLESLLDVALSSLEEVTDTDYNQILLISTSTYSRQLIAVADSIPAGKQRYRIAAFSGLLGAAFKSGKTINVGDVRERSGYFQAVPETCSELVVPIRSDGVVIGVLNSESSICNKYQEAISKKVGLLADALAAQLPLRGWHSSLSEKEAPWLRREPKR